jgi:cytochrome c-type biogenesis protein CcmH/NrfG
MAAWIGTALAICLRMFELYQEWRAKTSEVQRRVLAREEEKARLRKAMAEENGEEVSRIAQARIALARELFIERRLRPEDDSAK